MREAMKWFVFLLCFMPCLSFGFRDDLFKGEDRQRFQESLAHLGEGFDLLTFLAGQRYASAQQLLALLSRDLSQGEEFLKKYGRLKPIHPQGEEHLKIVFRYGKDFQISYDMVPMVTGLNDATYSVFFAEVLLQMTQGLGLLNALAGEGYGPAENLRNNFSRYTRDLMKQAGLPMYSLSLRLRQGCQREFAEYFTLGGKNLLHKGLSH